MMKRLLSWIIYIPWLLFLGLFIVIYFIHELTGWISNNMEAIGCIVQKWNDEVLMDKRPTDTVHTGDGGEE